MSDKNKKNQKDVFQKLGEELQKRETKEVSRKMISEMPIKYEPKRENRFLVRFGNVSLEEWVIKKVNKPIYNFQKGWGDINIELYDPIGPSSSQKIYKELITLAEIGELEDEYEMYMEMLDPTGVTIEKWKITGAFEEIDFGNGDYSSNELATIKMLFKPYYVILS